MAPETEASMADFGDSIDQATFDQILEMDEDEDERDFSKEIVFGFFDQAENTFKQMDAALENCDLEELSRLGHFLKGSSATLGLSKVRDSCEKIQHYGAKKDDKGDAQNGTDDHYLDLIRSTVATVRKEYAEVEVKLQAFFKTGKPE